jgi:hypothetical protein
MATSPSCTSISTGDPNAPWVIQFTGRLLTQTDIWIPGLTPSCQHNKQDDLHAELNILQQAFKQNGYSDKQIGHALYVSQKVKPPTDDPSPEAILPFTETTYNHISTMPFEHNGKETLQLPSRITQLLKH